MDLRKSVLTKNQQPNSTLSVSEKSLNSSILSAYDTADESMDNSLYYSFNNDSMKSIESNQSNISNLTSTTDHDMDDKENTTVIENVLLVTKTIVLKVGESDQKTACVNATDLFEENKSNAPVSTEVDENEADPDVVLIDDQIEVQTNSNDEISHRELMNEIPSEIDREENESVHEQSSSSVEGRQHISINDTRSPNDSDNNEVKNLSNTIDANPIIVIDDEPLVDPNENLVNPFIIPIIIPDSPTPSVRKSIRRSSIISTQAHYFSPVIRRSTDKPVVRPVAARRTVFSLKPTEIKAPVPRPRTAPASTSSDPKPSTSKDAASKKYFNLVKISKEIKKPQIASLGSKSKTSGIKPPVVQKSLAKTVENPVIKKTLAKTVENPSKLTATTSRSILPVKTVQSKPAQVKSPLEVPKPVKRKSSPRKAPSNTATTSTRSSGESSVPIKFPKLSQVTTQPCKYCGKRFKESTLINHWADNCTVIPLHEKKKISAQRERTEFQSKRRTTIFLAPPPTFNKNKTTTAVMNKSLNKSGVRITPKKSLKCHICGAIIEDAFSLAKHVLEHKFKREKEQREKEPSEN